MAGDIIDSSITFDSGEGTAAEEEREGGAEREEAEGGVWTIYGAVRRTGENSTLKITRAACGGVDFDYAMFVYETIMPNNTCKLLSGDSSGITFTNISVNNNQGGAVPWIRRSGRTDCDMKVAVGNTTGDVHMSWSHIN